MVEWSDVLTIGLLVLLEGLLSADNALVLAVLVLGLPQGSTEESASLRYPRGVLFPRGRDAARRLPDRAQLGEAARRGVPAVSAVLRTFSAAKKATIAAPPKAAKPMFGLTAFWATVVKVELTDIVFAIDSILVAVAMSNKTWVILTGGILGIIAMRLVIGKLLTLVQKYPGARRRRVHHHRVGRHQAAARVRAPEGQVHFEIPKWLALGLIVVIFGHRLLYARQTSARRRRRRSRGARLAGALTALQLPVRAPLALVGRVRTLQARAIHPL